MRTPRRSRRRRVLVVGGAGRMGRLFARFFRRGGFDVEICDPAGPLPGFRSAPLARAASADVVVVAASLSRSAAVLSAVAAERPKGLVFDIASVKAPLLPVLEAARLGGLSIASVHPMFGPTVRTFRGHDLIVCDCGDARAARRARALFEGAGLRIATMPVAEHDPWIARTMGLTHALALGAAAALAALDVGPDALDGRASTSFRRLVELIGPILDQEAELTRMIQAGNPEGEEALIQFEREMASVRKLLFHEPPSRLDATIRELRKAFGRRP
ncbi:MAG: prephenate dehydrogenase/arogenate dehydrogenase family protein [Acidithiobacillales bacterium]